VKSAPLSDRFSLRGSVKHSSAIGSPALIYLSASLGVGLDICRQTFVRKWQALTNRGRTVLISVERSAHGERRNCTPRLHKMCKSRPQYRHHAAIGRLDPCANR
jgi:hypothetical protein